MDTNASRANVAFMNKLFESLKIAIVGVGGTGSYILDFLSKTEDSEKRLELGAFEKLSGQFIGMITLENIDCNSFSCDLGYWISKPNTGKGLAFEGSTQLIQFAYDKLKIKRIDAFVIKEHIKSIALLERLGFEKMELLLENEENDGVLVDRYKDSLIKSNQTE